MQILSLLLLSLFSFSIDEPNAIRKAFQEAAISSENAQKFYEETQKINPEEAQFLISAYKGAASVILSKFEMNKKKRKELLKEGISTLEQCIKEHPQELELRFIRFVLQEQLPKIIKYNQNIEEDKKMILSNYKHQTRDLKNWMKEYILQSKSFTEEERKMIF